MIFFQVREKSGNFDISQGNLEKMGKVREFQNFPLNGMAKAVFSKVMKIYNILLYGQLILLAFKIVFSINLVEI